jgi:hypothetical protein
MNASRHAERFKSKTNGEKMDGGHKVRSTIWSVSLFLAVASFIVEIINIVRCSLLDSL